ncbi:MAG: hypothetical protein ABIA75_13655 [Candidatus Neomarinimicrobiota bacterium]
MTIVLITGIIAVIFGVLFIFAPDTVEKLNELGNTILATDDDTLLHRNLTGTLFIIIGLILFYIIIFHL